MAFVGRRRAVRRRPGERVSPTDPAVAHPEEPAAFGGLENGQHVGSTADGTQGGHVVGAGCGQDQECPGPGGQVGQLGREGPLEPLGQGQQRVGRGDTPGRRRAGELDEGQRVARRRGHDGRHLRVVQVETGAPQDQSGLEGVEAGERHDGVTAEARRGHLAASGDDHRDRAPGDPVGHEGEDGQRAGVDPLRVVDGDQDRTVGQLLDPAQHLQPLTQGIGRHQGQLAGTGAGPGWSRRQSREQLHQRGERELRLERLPRHLHHAYALLALAGSDRGQERSLPGTRAAQHDGHLGAVPQCSHEEVSRLDAPDQTDLGHQPPTYVRQPSSRPSPLTGPVSLCAHATGRRGPNNPGPEIRVREWVTSVEVRGSWSGRRRW